MPDHILAHRTRRSRESAPAFRGRKQSTTGNTYEGHEGRVQVKTIPFVDIFTPTLQLYDETEQPLTINGIHLKKTGNRLLAMLIDTAIFGEEPVLDAKQTKKLCEAILDKNLYCHNRYRATDGYRTFGGRDWLKFVDDQTNYVVLQRELEMLDVMSANRDKRIWETARGKEFTVDDSTTPEAIPVKTDLPGHMES